MDYLVPAIATQWSNCQYLHREAPSSRGPRCAQLVMIQKKTFPVGEAWSELRCELLGVFLFCYFKQNTRVQWYHFFVVRDLPSLPFEGIMRCGAAEWSWVLHQSTCACVLHGVIMDSQINLLKMIFPTSKIVNLILSDSIHFSSKSKNKFHQKVYSSNAKKKKQKNKTNKQKCNFSFSSPEILVDFRGINNLIFRSCPHIIAYLESSECMNFS